MRPFQTGNNLYLIEAQQLAPGMEWSPIRGTWTPVDSLGEIGTPFSLEAIDQAWSQSRHSRHRQGSAKRRCTRSHHR
ncbi:MAG: hypothetical protein H0V70_03185 [Ktedonobacteraceae bacterium]|nr:hypothetical protein [Ktedonobacteraceae bacterium]